MTQGEWPFLSRYPDLPTRHFLRLLRDTHPWLPFGCLVDHDVHGFTIAACFVIGPEKKHDGWFMTQASQRDRHGRTERETHIHTHTHTRAYIRLVRT